MDDPIRDPLEEPMEEARTCGCCRASMRRTGLGEGGSILFLREEAHLLAVALHTCTSCPAVELEAVP